MAPDSVSALLLVAIAAFVSAHIVRALRRGAFTFRGKTILRSRQPRGFWLVIGLLGAVTITLLVRATLMVLHG